MKKHKEEELRMRLLAAFERMTDDDRLAAVLFTEASAKENPRRQVELRLVVSRLKIAVR